MSERVYVVTNRHDPPVVFATPEALHARWEDAYAESAVDGFDERGIVERALEEAQRSPGTPILTTEGDFVTFADVQT